MMNKNVLVITNKEDVTVDFVIHQLQMRNIEYYRFNTEDIGSSIDIYFDGISYDAKDDNKKRNIHFNDFSSVYFRRPKLPEPLSGLTSGEKQFYLTEISTYLEGLYRYLSEKYWLNSVFDIRMLENKPYQITLAKELGLLVPELCISNDAQKCCQFTKEYKSCIFKPLKVGLIQETEEKGKVLYTTKVDSKLLKRMDTNGAMPIYLQREIEKESDIRITVVGTKIFAARIMSQESEISQVDWRKSHSMLSHERIDVPSELKEKFLNLCAKFNLGFAAIDFVLDKNGQYWFLEINPNGQWAWIESLLDYPISREIVNLLVEG